MTIRTQETFWPMRLTRRMGMAMVATFALAGCSGGNAACESPRGRIELTLTADTMTPNDPTTCRDLEVTLIITPDVDGVFHIHGYDEQVQATSITAGEVIELDFIATRSGQFPIELHTDENTEGASIGVFTVHEP